MATREAYLAKESARASLDIAEALLKKSEDFDLAIQAQVIRLSYSILLLSILPNMQ